MEDEPAVAQLVVDQLAPLEAECTIVHDAQAALQALRADHFDAITIDVMIGAPDGIELIEQIRTDRQLQSIPAVFVTVATDRPELGGEWVVRKPIDAGELRRAMVAAIRSGRPRVLAIGRPQTQAVLEPELDDLGIEYEWTTTGATAVRVSGERRFEVALVDVGVRNPEAALEALTLRGRRLRRALILFSDGETPIPSAIVDQGIEIVPIGKAAQVVLAALRGDREQPTLVADGAQNRN